MLALLVLLVDGVDVAGVDADVAACVLPAQLAAVAAAAAAPTRGGGGGATEVGTMRRRPPGCDAGAAVDDMADGGEVLPPLLVP